MRSDAWQCDETPRMRTTLASMHEYVMDMTRSMIHRHRIDPQEAQRKKMPTTLRSAPLLSTALHIDVANTAIHRSDCCHEAFTRASCRVHCMGLLFLCGSCGPLQTVHGQGQAKNILP